MPDVDLNQKVWGVKAQTHFYGFSMIYVMISFINLVTIIDLMALPSNASAELRSHAYFTYLGDIGITMVCACFFLLILFCIRNKTIYGVVAVFLIVTSALIGFNSCLELLIPKPMIPLPSFFQAKVDEVYKYYKYSLIGISIVRIFQSFAKIYLGIVLLKLSFCAPRPVIYVDHHRRRSRSDFEQRSGGDEEEEEMEEDIEEKPRSKKKDVEKNDKSGKSGNSGNSKSGTGTGKSEKSLEKSKSGTGEIEKSGKNGNSGN